MFSEYLVTLIRTVEEVPSSVSTSARAVYWVKLACSDWSEGKCGVWPSRLSQMVDTDSNSDIPPICPGASAMCNGNFESRRRSACPCRSLFCDAQWSARLASRETAAKRQEKIRG